MKLSSFVKYFRLRVINTGGIPRAGVLALFLILAAPVMTAQVNPSRPSGTEARDAWEKGNYELAYSNYNGLLLLYSRDPVYKYYTGACLVELKRDLPRALTLLGSAISNSVNVKSVPEDVWFYYGRALQMNGNFEQAGEAYDRFVKVAGRKAAQEYKVQTFIDQCRMGGGAIKADKDDGIKYREEQEDIRTEKKVTEIPPEQQKVLSEAVIAQHNADSMSFVAENLRGNAEKALPDKKKELDIIAGEAEKKAAEGQASADSLFRSLEKQKEPEKVEAPVKVDTPPVPGSLYAFEVKAGKSYDAGHPVPVDGELPSGLVYTIQIAAFRNVVAPSLFGGLYPVFGRKNQDSGATFYYTGLFRKLNDARNALSDVRGAGFSDAFIIAFMDGVRVSIEKAGQLEKEWASKPLPGQDAAGAKNKNTPDTTPVGTLSFRAEVIRSVKPLKPEILEKIELLAGTRGLETIKNTEGETVFLIGNFITFESADEYVSLLIRNGYSNARVAAYIGTQEIPLQTAKELLNKMPDD